MGKKEKNPKKTGTSPLAVIMVTLLAAVIVAAAVAFLNRWELVLTLNGEDTVTMEYGTEFSDPGARAVYKGSILFFMTEDVPVTVSEADISDTGTYTITYTADHENQHAEAERTVHVVDTTPPRLILKSSPDSYTPFNHPYEEEGCTAIDTHDGDISDRIEKEEKDGKVYYTVADSAGNRTDIVREIFYDDRKGPVFNLEGGEEITVYAGEGYADYFTAEDDVDGDVTDLIEISGSVDSDTPGEYVITYRVSDSHGNVSETSRTVYVIRKPVNTPSVSEDAKTIYLTFDDGPGAYTDELLEILARYNVKATFFTTSAYPGYAYCMAKEAAAGHTVAVHSATHDYAEIYSSTDAYWADFNRQNAVIAAQTGSYSNLFRFPGGSSNTVSRNYCSGIMTTLVNQAAAYGYTYFDWNVSSGDAGETTDTYTVYANVISGIQYCTSKGRPSVVLQHDVKAYSVNAVEDIIKWGLENGYTFNALSAGSFTAHHGLNN